MSLIALDCTMRDGGYYTNFEFDLSLVNTYLEVMELAKIDAVEVGFRSPSKEKADTFANVTDEFIEEVLYIPNIRYFGVMINAKSFDRKLITQMFRESYQSPINLVRVAVHFIQLDQAEELLKELKDLGYTTTINLMQAADKSYDEIRSAAETVRSWRAVDVLYLADSLGGMNHDTVNYAFQAIREGWNGLVGFHGHNNKGQSLSNTLEAIDIGVDWVDGTMMGMGRGAGNTETEYLLNELNKRNFEFENQYVEELAMVHFYEMKTKYKWGPSLPYYLAAEYSIHPTYVQIMLAEQDIVTVYNAIRYLEDKESNTFNKELYQEAINV